MVSAIILGYRKGWTIKELLKQIDFNLLTRTALGLNRMDDTAFFEATAGILFCSGAISGETGERGIWIYCPLHGRSCDPMWNPPSRSL